MKDMIDASHAMFGNKDDQVLKPELVLSTTKKNCRIWVEREPKTGQIHGFVQSLTNKVGKKFPVKKAMLGIGDHDFAKAIAKDFSKKVVRGLGHQRRTRAPLRR